MQRENNKNGYVMLALLIGIVILALLYMIDLTAMFGPMGKIDIYAQRPWFEDKRILPDEAFPIKQPGKKGQVVIKELTKLTGTVVRNNETRGNIEITIDPNGKAYGQWNCAYQYTDSSYKIDANFAGNIDPTKIYEDKKGKNKKLLFVITKGKYKQTKTDIKTNGSWPSEEAIYVVGWIHPVRDNVSLISDSNKEQPVSNGTQNDFSAKGKLFLMTSEGGNAEYDWQTGSADLKNSGDNK